MPITPAPAVVRACDVLDALADGPEHGLTVSELSRLADVPRATCDAVLLALADGGLVVREGDRRYVLGHRCIALGDAARATNSLLRAASLQAEAIARRMGACVAVCLSDGELVTVADVADHSPPFTISTRTGQTVALRAPFGAVFVAWEPPRRVARWLAETEVDEVTRRTWDDALAEVRRLGYSVGVTRGHRTLDRLDALARDARAGGAPVELDELYPDLLVSHGLAVGLDDEQPVRINQLSAPVFDRAGHVVASIMALGPDTAMTGAEVHALGRRVLEAADRVTRGIGGRRPAVEHLGEAG
jgi:DNA-binding IclR family transcriptional regulator